MAAPRLFRPVGTPDRLSLQATRASNPDQEARMQWTLEVVQIPVADVDRAKAFYVDLLGFGVDFDMSTDDGKRFAQLTPPGSGCSIQLSAGYFDMVPGCQRGLVLVVPDVRAAAAELAARGLETAGVVVSHDGVQFRPATDDDRFEQLDNVGFVHVTDPDGNEWAVQQISSRGTAT
jgi:catechol 2,3-dioxygenase-like lactoylglutathione lyase family enzyme